MSDRERGFALLIALWSVVLLAFLTTQLASTGRSELQIAANLRTAAGLEATADGLVYEAIFRLMSGSPGWGNLDGRDYPVAIPGGRGVVRVTSLAGKLNPNTVRQPLLTALLRRVGVSPLAATSLAAAIVDWRTPGLRPRPGGAKAAQYAAAGYGYAPPGAAFETVEELGEVLGMTPDILGRLKGHLSVFYPGSPLLAAADPVVAGALEEVGSNERGDDLDDGTEEGSRGNEVYARVQAQVTLANGAAFTRRVDVWAGQGFRRGLYLILRWDVPNDE